MYIKKIDKMRIMVLGILFLGILSGCSLNSDNKEDSSISNSSESTDENKTYSIEGMIEEISFASEHYIVTLSDVITDSGYNEYPEGVILYIPENLIKYDLSENDRISILLPVDHIVTHSGIPVIPGDFPLKVSLK